MAKYSKVSKEEREELLREFCKAFTRKEKL